jgi:hypothetical protein
MELLSMKGLPRLADYVICVGSSATPVSAAGVVVGCGVLRRSKVGRIARVVSSSLSKSRRYEGIDPIGRSGIIAAVQMKMATTLLPIYLAVMADSCVQAPERSSLPAGVPLTTSEPFDSKCVVVDGATPPVEDTLFFVPRPDQNLDCRWPRDEGNMSHARVTLVVYVAPDGTAQRLEVFDDPGHGFAREACRCAMAAQYEVVRDAGADVGATVQEATRTRPFHVRFSR